MRSERAPGAMNAVFPLARWIFLLLLVSINPETWSKRQRHCLVKSNATLPIMILHQRYQIRGFTIENRTVSCVYSCFFATTAPRTNLDFASSLLLITLLLCSLLLLLACLLHLMLFLLILNALLCFVGNCILLLILLARNSLTGHQNSFSH